MGTAPLGHTTQPGWAAMLLLTGFTVAAFAQGAFYGGASATSVVILGASAVLSWRVLRIGQFARPVPLALGALGLWAVASAALAGETRAGLPVLGLTIALVVVLAVTSNLIAMERAVVADGIIAITALVALTGWIGVVWRIEPWARSVQHLWRAEGALTYANALAAMVVIGVLLALAVSTRRARPALTAASTLLLTALAASMSRGAIIALLAGLAVAGTLLGARAMGRALVPPLVGAAIAFAALLPALPDTSASRPVLGIAGLAAGLLTARALAGASARALAAGVVLLIVCASIAIASVGAVDRILDARFTLASQGRSSASAAALEVALEHPIAGAGPGQVALAWERNGRLVTTRYVHNEYLQTLAELGAIGAALLIALGVAMARAWRRSGARAADRALWAGVAAALVALAVHSTMDFLWHIPAFPVLGIALFGLVSPLGKDAR